MGVRVDWCYTHDGESCVSRGRDGVCLPCLFMTPRSDVSFSLQINVLNLVGVKHLFVVPRIRTSAYIELLAEKCPSIKHSLPGQIHEDALPQLRNLVVVDNEDVFQEELRSLKVKSLIDWREVFAWREDDVSLNKRLDDTSQSLSNDDVINIQFTRFAATL